MGILGIGDNPGFHGTDDPNDPNSEASKKEDAFSLGGYSGQHTPQDQYGGGGAIIPGTSYADQLSKRYQSLGQAWANRQAPQGDYGQANSYLGLAGQDRSQALNGMNMNLAIANGSQKGLGEALVNSSTNDAYRQALSLGASQRGAGAMGASSANAANANAMLTAQGIQNAGVVKAQEAAQARAAYMQGAMGLSAQDAQNAALTGQWAGENAKLQLGQEGLGLGAQQGYEGMSLDAEKTALQARIDAQAAAQGQWQVQSGLDQNSTNAATGVGMGITTGVLGALSGGIGSDERIKSSVRPADNRAKFVARPTDFSAGNEGLRAGLAGMGRVGRSFTQQAANGSPETDESKPVSYGGGIYRGDIYSDVNKKDDIYPGVYRRRASEVFPGNERGMEIGQANLSESHTQSREIGGEYPRASAYAQAKGITSDERLKRDLQPSTIAYAAGLKHDKDTEALHMRQMDALPHMPPATTRTIEMRGDRFSYEDKPITSETGRGENMQPHHAQSRMIGAEPHEEAGPSEYGLAKGITSDKELKENIQTPRPHQQEIGERAARAAEYASTVSRSEWAPSQRRDPIDLGRAVHPDMGARDPGYYALPGHEQFSNNVTSDETLKETYAKPKMSDALRRTEADKFLDTLQPFSYRYKDSADEPTSQPSGGRYLGVMAQNVEKGPTGDTIVSDTPRGKRLEGGAMMSAMAAGLGRLNQRLQELETARSKGWKNS